LNVDPGGWMKGGSTPIYRDQREWDNFLDDYATPPNNGWFPGSQSTAPAQLPHDQMASVRIDSEIFYHMQWEPLLAQ